jgi:hypothetical protein
LRERERGGGGEKAREEVKKWEYFEREREEEVKKWEYFEREEEEEVKKWEYFERERERGDHQCVGYLPVAMMP